MTIRRSASGGKTVIAERPNRTVVVSHSPSHGYVQRPFTYRNRTYVRRTYYVHHAHYPCYYRPYYHRGVTVHVYAPYHFYHPAFYVWAYAPWHAPVYYTWGWAASPWYGYYGWYFAPYPVYAGPAFWLTDYYIASTLEAAYEDRIAAAEARAEAAEARGQEGISPEVKQAIADEVQRQIELEKAEAENPEPAEASSGLPPGLADGRLHVFVVSQDLDVNSASDSAKTCSLTEGDVIKLSAALEADSDTATAVVLASKRSDCAKGIVVEVGVSDLIEMQNQMRATIDRGLEELRSKQGQKGIPALPADAKGPPRKAAYAASAPPPDSDAKSEIARESAEGDRVEQEIVSEASSSDTAPANPVDISLGQTIEEVVAAIGQPSKIVHLGVKKIYVYSDLKITFVDGKVSDVQ